MLTTLTRLGETIILGATVLLPGFKVKAPVHFTEVQFERPMIVKPTPTPTPIPTPTPEPEIKTLKTDYGEIRYRERLEDFWAVSYDSSCEGCDSVTATGMKQGFGVVAVDPKVIPLYTKVYVPGYGIGVAGDVGGAVKGKIIDLGFDKLEGQWSARYVDVYILEE